MLRKILILSGYLALVAFLVVTLSFAGSESRNVICKEIQIELRDDDVIKIGREEIKKMILSADNHVVGKELRHINTEVIEQHVEKHQAIQKAEVFKIMATDTSSYKGILGVRVKHREPVVRVMAASDRYYLDETGEKIPVSSSYTARVLVATGNFSEEYARTELLPFIQFLNASSFWRAQVEQVHVDSNGDVFLIPLVGEQLIEFGTIKDYAVKLRNLKAFYEQVMTQNKWNDYKVINLKYKNQVIAKKR